ncbi:VapE domain-containing protein [Staphylococcus equorum]|uniref:VapE domain-containing protein n=1 Tax=Staphylococcus equorum TaxID=246432 RepID=UPI003EB8B493
MAITEKSKIKMLKYPRLNIKGTNDERNCTWEEIINIFEKPMISQPMDESDASVNDAKFKSGLYMFGKFDDADGVNNRKTKNNIMYRSALCLDYDDIEETFENALIKLNKQLDDATVFSSYLIHTTYKHTKDKPRFRVIIPLTESISPSDYSRSINYLSSLIDFKIDESSQEPARLMCAPNIQSETSHYYCKAYNNEFLDTQMLLNWVDIWETSVNKNKKNNVVTRKKDVKNDWNLISQGTSEGGRNKTLTKLIGKQISMGFDEDFILASALTWGERCDPPMDEKEVKNVFNSITNRSNKNWQENLQISERGNVKGTFLNAELILQNDETIHDLLAYDVFSHVIKFKKRPYWKHNYDNNLDLSDFDITAYKRHFESYYNIGFGSDKVIEIAEWNAKESSYHPIKSKIESKEWDGVKRAESLFIDFLGAEDTPYHKAITKVSLTGAVARIYKPGVKFDTTLVMLGNQGDAKSWTIQKLGMGHSTDSLKSLETKDDMQMLQGSWLIELAELSALKKTGIEESKAFLTATEDKFRLPYGRLTGTYKRQCAFFGTTNNHEFLKDKTGNRRFLPMIVRATDYATKSVSSELTEEYVQQVWAEVLTWWRDKSIDEMNKLVLSPEMEEIAMQHQEEHTEQNSYQGVVDEYLEIPIPNYYYKLTIEERRHNAMNPPSLLDFTTYENGYVVDMKNSKPGEWGWKTKVCAQEIWYLALGNTRKPKDHEIRTINQAIRSSQYCVKSKNGLRYGQGIGQTRGFEVNLEKYYENINQSIE